MKEALLSHKNKKNNKKKKIDLLEEEEENEIWKDFLINHISMSNSDEN